MKKLTVLFLFSLLFIVACQNSGQQGDDMGQFAEEEEFKDQHETPEKIDFKGNGSMATFDIAGGESGSAYVVGSRDAEYVLLMIHEWWGLNDHIKQEADRLAAELGNVNVMALDMYDGKVADTPDKAGELMQSVKQERLEAIINGGVDFISSKMKSTPKIATVGWCFGGGWSLRASILVGDRGAGCVMYYGMPVQTAEELAPLEADILGIFAAQEQWINKEVVSKFDKLTKATGKNFEYHFFEADHAFANPSSPRYNEEAATKANDLVLTFLKEKLQ